MIFPTQPTYQVAIVHKRFEKTRSHRIYPAIRGLGDTPQQDALGGYDPTMPSLLQFSESVGIIMVISRICYSFSRRSWYNDKWQRMFHPIGGRLSL